MPTRTLTLAALALLTTGPIAAQQTPNLAPYLMTDRNAEVKLARSAAPKAVSDSATVLVLTRTGYVEAARGSNGFSCLVVRSFMGSLDDPGYWNARTRAPHCFNPPAARTVLVEMLKRAEWVMGGVGKTDVAARTERAYASHDFPMPAPGAMAYMLSPAQHLLDEDPQWMPHLMFYHDKSMPAAAWGAGGLTAPIIDGSAGAPRSPVLTLLIPVRRWSDGTPSHPSPRH
jgi:hypothetical protein